MRSQQGGEESARRLGNGIYQPERLKPEPLELPPQDELELELPPQEELELEPPPQEPPPQEPLLQEESLDHEGKLLDDPPLKILD